MKEPYERGQSLLAGETVTGGEFRCLACGYELGRPGGEVTNLPVCPRCQADRWGRG